MSRYNYMVFIESRYFSGFFILSVQLVVSSWGQGIVPITEMDRTYTISYRVITFRIGGRRIRLNVL